MKRNSLVFLCYWTVFLFLFRDVAFGPATFMSADIYPFYYPVWHLVVSMFKSGSIPLWDPYMGFGAPLLASPQACVFYPLTLFFYGPDFLAGFNHYLLFHLAMASFFTYRFVRGSGVSESGALISGLTFGLSGYLLGTLHLAITLCSVSYFPLVLLLLRRSFLDRRFFWKGATSAALLMQYLAGDPMISFITIVVCLLCAAYRLRRDRYPVACFLEIGVYFAGLSAIQSLLFVEFILQSTRFLQQITQATRWSVAPEQLWGLILPFWMDMSSRLLNQAATAPAQHWLANVYIGFPAVFLAIAGIGKGSTEKKLLWLGLFGIVLALGQYSPVYIFLCRFVWPFGIIRFPVRFFFLVLFSVACLAGFGFDRLGSRRRLWREVMGIFFIVFSLAVSIFPKPVAAAIVSFLQHSAALSTEQALLYASSMVSGLQHSLFYGSGAVIFFLACSRFKMPPAWKTAFMLLWLFMDLSSVNALEPRIPRSEAVAVPGNVAEVLKDPGLFRVMTSLETVRAYEQGTFDGLAKEVRDYGEIFFPNMPLLYRLHFFWAYDSLLLRKPFEVGHDIALQGLKEGKRWLDRINVKYVASLMDSPPDGFTLIRKDPAGNLFLNTTVCSRAFLVPDALAVKKGAHLDFEADGDYQEAAVTEYTPNRVRMTAEPKGNSWLFFSDTFYPGWTATVDGSRVRIWRAHGAFRSILLTPGKHSIVWAYKPRLFQWGGVLSVLTLLVMVLRLWKDM